MKVKRREPAIKYCPVCNGRKYNTEQINDNPNHTVTYVCKACDGEGWVAYQDTEL